jgi:hypothetical protein
MDADSYSETAGTVGFGRRSFYASLMRLAPQKPAQRSIPRASPGATPVALGLLRINSGNHLGRKGVGFGRRSTLLTAPLAAWLGELDAPGASYHGRAAGKVSNVGGVLGPVLRGCDNHHHDRQDYRYHSERDALGRHCVLQEVR